jgi:serine/threonine protein kinase
MARDVLVADFGGRYRLDRCLGAGGMGEVWLAYDEDLDDRPVAIKMMRFPMRPDAEGFARFQREMRLASRMHHPNIMTVFTTGSDQGVPFMVMEYLQGSDLEKRPVGWSFEDIARIGRETCMALAYAHSLSPGVVHRDIKPGNLFVCDTGLVKVTDFGLAKAVTENSLSTTGKVLGTMPYISPEQWLGVPAAFSNDVWAVGCVLYELLAGRPPRRCETPIEHVTAAARGDFVDPLPSDGGVPAWLADAVMAMLHPDHLNRPAAGEALQMLSARRAYNVRAQDTLPQQSAVTLQSPARRDMASVALPRTGAQPPSRPTHPPAFGLVAAAGATVSPRVRQEAPSADVSARAFFPAFPPAETPPKPRKHRNPLISWIAVLGVVAAGAYLAVSVLTGSAPSQRRGPATIPASTLEAPPGTGHKGPGIVKGPPAGSRRAGNRLP